MKLSRKPVTPLSVSLAALIVATLATGTLPGCKKDSGDDSATTEKSSEAAKPATAVAPAEGTKPTLTNTAAKAPTATTTAPGEPTVAIGGNKTVTEMGTKTAASTPDYDVRLTIPDDAKSGADAKVMLTVTPKKGWKLNKEFPTSLKVTPPAGVKVKKASQKLPDAVSFDEKKGAQWAISFSAEAAGDKKFAAKFKFAVCDADTCVPKKEQLSWVVAVK